MKLMFASDIHGSLPATERVLERFAQSGARWLASVRHGRQCLPAAPVGYLQGYAHKPLWGVADTTSPEFYEGHGH
ncbi:phosphodiesterase, partial [Salmonella enterica subsp. enterica serovar Heidelberg str. 41566]